MPSFGAKRGGATSAPPMIREAPFGVGGAYAVDHPEFDRTLHMRNAKHKHGMKFGAMKEKELAFVPDRELTHQIYAENRGLRKQNDIAFRGGAGDILGHDGLALEVKNFSDVEKVGDNKYDRRTYRRNHRKYIAISAHANNRSKNMKRALIHSDNPMAILTGGA